MNFKFVPLSLVYLRFIIAPFLLWDALDGQTGWVFIALYLTGFISDILDGVIARKLGVSTAKLRQADSWADMCFYLCLFASAGFVYPHVISEFAIPLLSVVFVQIIWWIVNLIKYKKPASYHTYSAKLWGVTLFIATIALFGFNTAGMTLELAIIVGILHTLEEIVMTLILPEWTHDVLSVVHAWQLQEQQKILTSSEAQQS